MSNDPYLAPEFPAPPKSARRNHWLIQLLAVGGILFLLIVVLLPARRTVRGASERTQCLNNIRNITVALFNYHQEHNGFPPAYTINERRQKLHSWRTLILPYLDEQQLYDSIDLSKPWDDPVNLEAGENRPTVFSCPSAKLADSHTTYMAFVGDDRFLLENHSRMLDSVPDGSQCLAVIDVSTALSTHWMNPTDTANEFASEFTRQSLNHNGVAIVAFADGSASTVSQSISPETLSQLMSVSENVTSLEGW